MRQGQATGIVHKQGYRRDTFSTKASQLARGKPIRRVGGIGVVAVHLGKDSSRVFLRNELGGHEQISLDPSSRLQQTKGAVRIVLTKGIPILNHGLIRDFSRKTHRLVNDRNANNALVETAVGQGGQ